MAVVSPRRSCTLIVLVLAVLVVSGGFGAPRASAAQPAPACAPGTPAAVTFEGLSRRSPFGPPRYFWLGETLEDWELEGDIAVRMVDTADGEPFFEGTVSPDEDLYVKLDLDDAPVAITATFTQWNPYADELEDVAPEATTCTQSVTRTVTGYRRIVLPPACAKGAYRPRRFIVACGDGNFQLRGLRWRRWNRGAATAHGTAIANDCIPYCAKGTFHSYPVRVRASRIGRCRHDGDRLRYTRLHITYRGARPPRSPRRLTHDVWCAPPF